MCRNILVAAAPIGFAFPSRVASKGHVCLTAVIPTAHVSSPLPLELRHLVYNIYYFLASSYFFLNFAPCLVVIFPAWPASYWEYDRMHPLAVRHLVTVYGKDDSLYPKDPKRRAIVDQRMHFDNGILYVRTRSITFPVLVLGKTELTQDKFDALEEAYDYLEAYLNVSEWLAGDQLTIADFCTVATLTVSDMVLPLDRTKYPKTIAWWNKLSQRQSYKEYCEPGALKLTNMYKNISLTIIK